MGNSEHINCALCLYMENEFYALIGFIRHITKEIN